MTALERLKLIANEKYSNDGEEYTVELNPGITPERLNQLVEMLPAGKMPDDIKELLNFSTGFKFHGIDEITFDGIGLFGFEEAFPYSAEIARDGLGNSWIVDIDSGGNWGNVFYVCHDPPVIMKAAENLAQFIQFIDEYGKNYERSNLGAKQDKAEDEIWSGTGGFMTLNEARVSDDNNLKEFATNLPDNFVIADLRERPNQSGFAWGKFGPGVDIRRHERELLWGIEKPVKKNFISKLFGRFKKSND